jgi:hypothetical protein
MRDMPAWASPLEAMDICFYKRNEKERTDEWNQNKKAEGTRRSQTKECLPPSCGERTNGGYQTHTQTHNREDKLGDSLAFLVQFGL